MDQSKKTMRHFYCRDVLWETFEQMANDFDCSIDYLINEAMRYYARSKNYQSAAPAGLSQPSIATVPAQPYGAMAGGAQSAHSGAVRRIAAPPPPPQAPAPSPVPTPPRRSSASLPQATSTRSGPAPAYREPVSSAPTLYLIYNGHRYPIAKDQFIIGRGSKTSDLAIKDGNISRKHAAVIRRNGTYYIKDLGSTNGIDYKGMRIDNKRVDEGDIFHICDYELRFTYRPE